MASADEQLVGVADDICQPPTPASKDKESGVDDVKSDASKTASLDKEPELDATKEVKLDVDDPQTIQMSEAKSAHIEQFVKYTGMTPKCCYRLVLVSLTLRVMGGCWIAMVGIEYTRYYVINDLGELDVLRTLTGSPQYAVQAFLFPFLGVVSDRVSRKKLIAASSLAMCVSTWLLTLIPSVEIYIVTKVFALIADVGGPIRDAMLRDIFSAQEWESSQGGVTGLRARMALFAQVGFGLAMAIGMGIMKLGEMGIGFPNEYTLHKGECGKHHCVTPGNFSWDGDWAVDGSLRLLMVLGSVVLSLDVLLIVFAFPETIKPESRTSAWQLVKQNWQVLAPWNNLRVFATEQLRMLMSIRCIGYFLAAGGGSIFMSFYSRFEFDTFTMMIHTVLAGSATWFTTLAVPLLVERHGDLRGIWIPGTVISILYAFSCALMPAGYGFMVYVTWPLLAGPSFALNGFSADVMAKLIPGDVQGTFQTAKSFSLRLSQAIFMWPWNQLFVHTQNLGYPFDATCVWISIALGFVMLFLTIRMLSRDPREAISSGKALDAFMASPYAQSGWYQQHASKNAEGDAVGDCNSVAQTHKQVQQLDLVQAAAVLSRQRSLDSSQQARAVGPSAANGDGATARAVEPSAADGDGATVTESL